MKELYYKVAEHVFSLDMGTRGDLLCDLRQYEPFVTDPTENVVFSLWLKYIEGTELVNDDNPVVRVLENGEVWVYGSPWSGKTPCYRNVSYPVGAIVKLSQAPYNKIQPLKGIKAYAALVPSISGKRWDKVLAEGLHETENLIAQHARIWHLDCLPDEAAAQLCCKTCTSNQ